MACAKHNGPQCSYSASTYPCLRARDIEPPTNCTDQQGAFASRNHVEVTCGDLWYPGSFWPCSAFLRAQLIATSPTIRPKLLSRTTCGVVSMGWVWRSPAGLFISILRHAAANGSVDGRLSSRSPCS